MTKILFTDGWQTKFEQAGLSSFDDFFNYAGGKIVNQNTKRDVMSFSINVDGCEHELFMKRFYSPHYKDTLFTFRNYHKFCSQGFIEWANARNLIDSGIDSYHPLCYGEKMAGPFEKCSFVVTSKLGGICLTDYLAQNWHNMSPSDRNQLLKAMAQLAARTHKHGFSLPDLYVWHYFITPSNNGFELAVIDLHRMKLRANRHDFARNLGYLHFSMIDKYFSDTDRQYLLDCYFEARNIASSRMLKGIMKRSNIQKNRRRKPVY